MEISELRLIITALEFYLKSKQQLNNASNDEINDIKYLIWQLRYDLEREIKNKKIYGEQRYHFDIHQNYNSRSAPIKLYKHTKRPYFKKHKK